MNPNMLAIKLFNAPSITHSQINFNNQLMDIKAADKEKMMKFFAKGTMRFAIKDSKMKAEVEGIFLLPTITINSAQKMTIGMGYVATTKKEVIDKIAKMLNKILTLKDLPTKLNTIVVPRPVVNDTPLSFNESPLKPETPLNSTDKTPIFFDLGAPEPPIVAPPVPTPTPMPATNNIPVFDMSKESNLEEAIDEIKPEISSEPKFNGIPAVNENKATLNSNINEKEHNNILEDTAKLRLQPMPSQQVNGKIEDEEEELTNSGHINTKLLTVIVVVLFIGSCVFLGYEIHQIVQLKPEIINKYFS